MEKLTEADIAELIAENARLRQSLKYYSDGKFGVSRSRIPESLIDYKFYSAEEVELLSKLIRNHLFRETAKVTEHYAVVGLHQHNMKVKRHSVIALNEMTNDQYDAYSAAFCGVISALDSARKL